MTGHELRRRRMKLGVSQLRVSAVIAVPLETLARWEEQGGEIPAEYEFILESTFDAFDRELLTRFIWAEPVREKVG